MRRLVPLVVLAVFARPLVAQNPPAEQAAPPPAPQRTVQFSGLVLVNGFFTNAGVNNSDVPQLAERDTVGVAGSGGTIRQTRLGVLVTDPSVLGGTFTGELDVDFFGGQQPSSGGRTFPLLRLRRAIGVVQWSHAQLLFGQESPLVAERSPRSLASVGFPDFAGAGNLWLWLPQGRLTLETGYSLRIALQVRDARDVRLAADRDDEHLAAFKGVRHGIDFHASARGSDALDIVHPPLMRGELFAEFVP